MSNNLDLKRAAEKLRAAASRISRDPLSLDLELRTKIERSIFLSAKKAVFEAVGYELHSFAGDAKSSVEIQFDQEGAALEIRDLVMRAFELKAVLEALAGSDAYISDELSAEFSAGRKEAMLVFATRLRKFTDLLVSQSNLE